VLSLGEHQDRNLFLWDWEEQDAKHATLFHVVLDDAEGPVHDVAFAGDGSYFVTVGQSHVRHWHLDRTSGVVVTPHRAKLGLHEEATFIQAECGQGSNSAYLYALTSTGILCAFKHKQGKKKRTPSSSPAHADSTAQAINWEIEKWVDLRLQVCTHTHTQTYTHTHTCKHTDGL
jgi:hypothetical protein